MKVCVTGGTGYIGSWCIHYLLKDGHDVVTTVCDPASAKAKFLREGYSSKHCEIKNKTETEFLRYLFQDDFSCVCLRH